MVIVIEDILNRICKRGKIRRNCQVFIYKDLKLSKIACNQEHMNAVLKIKGKTAVQPSIYYARFAFSFFVDQPVIIINITQTKMFKTESDGIAQLFNS